MPRYFFNLTQSGVTASDDIGVVLPHVDAARSEAIKAAREIMAEGVRAGIAPNGHSFEVTDGAGKLLFTLRFTDALCA